jgi:hypothetical protein
MGETGRRMKIAGIGAGTVGHASRWYSPAPDTKSRCATPWLVKSRRDPAEIAKRFRISLKAAVLPSSRGGRGRPRAMRRPGESYSQVILRPVELERSDLK